MIVGFAAAADAQSTFVKATEARVFAAPAEGSAVIATRAAGQVVELILPERGAPAGFQRVQFHELPDGHVVDGWMAVADLWLPDSLSRVFWSDRKREAADALLAEASGTTDLPTASFYRLRAAYAQQATGDGVAALTTLDAVARSGGQFAPIAYLAAARIRTERDDLAAVVTTYEAMLRAFPDYRVDERLCWENPAAPGRSICGGDKSVATRLDAVRLLMSQRAALEPKVADVTRPAVDRAATAVALADAWQVKTAIDPGPNPETFQTRSDAARRLYERARQLAPGSTPAGDAAWRLIEFARPYEWEGDIDARYAWTLQQYRPFVGAYPTHAHAGDALFEIARATWAHGGYPEAFSWVGGPGYSPGKVNALEPWFDTRGFGGGPGVTFPPPDPVQARAALAIFQRIVADDPGSESAAMSSYYVAVIYDYCLKDSARAIPAYEAFIAAHGALEPYATKATQRLAALRR
jgi:tetratricopeptide (TPR) repeat protein